MSQKVLNMIISTPLTCQFPDGRERRLRALSLPSLHIPDGSAFALIGPSGSGKSTLFHCLSGLLRPASGRITIDGVEITALGERPLSAWRAGHVGYIFQQALLFPYLTVRENILLAARIAGRGREARREADEWLARTGLNRFADRLPAHLSGGEKQRVGFIRAIITAPRLLLADEPTASLDRENGRLVMEYLLSYHRRSGCTLLCATHDPAVQALFPRQIRLGEVRP